METNRPTAQDFDELTSFLGRLYEPGFDPIKQWYGGAADENGYLQWPWPDYEETVIEFVRAAGKGCWTDFDYVSKDVSALVDASEDRIKTADLETAKSILTWCIRGERFCEGHWGVVIGSGIVRRVLERLLELRPES